MPRGSITIGKRTPRLPRHLRTRLDWLDPGQRFDVEEMRGAKRNERIDATKEAWEEFEASCERQLELGYECCPAGCLNCELNEDDVIRPISPDSIHRASNVLSQLAGSENFQRLLISRSQYGGIDIDLECVGFEVSIFCGRDGFSWSVVDEITGVDDGVSDGWLLPENVVDAVYRSREWVFEALDTPPDGGKED